MTARHWDRTTSVIALITLVALVHLALLFGFVVAPTKALPKSNRVIRGVSNFVPIGDEILTFREGANPNQFLICAIDPDRRTIRDLDLPMPPKLYGVVVNDQRIWLVDTAAVIEWDGSKQTVYKQPRLLNSPLGMAFPFEGRPAIVDLDDAGIKYRLKVFNEGEWHDRGEVAIPALGSTWEDDPLTGATKLCPPSITKAPARPGDTQAIFVKEVNDIPRVFVFDYASCIMTYRDGLDLIEPSEVASASNPENVRAESTGWIEPNMKPGLWGMAASKDRLIVVTQVGEKEPIRFLEKPLDPPGQPFTLTAELPLHRWETLSMIYLPKNDEWYFIRERNTAAKFYRYLHGELRDTEPLWDDELTSIVQWVRPLIGRCAGILTIGLVLLIVGAEWISRSESDRYQFGKSTMQLAPIWLRCVARGIDVSLMLVPLAFGLSRLSLYQIGSDVLEIRDQTPLTQIATGQVICTTMIWTAIASFVLIITQGLWGLTPGKWLCGLRVRAATLRRCGLSRSLLREFGFLADAPALLTVIPGIASMLCTSQRARLGDQLADTIVVTAGSESTDKREASLSKAAPESALASPAS